LKLEVYGLRLPEVKPGDDLALLILEAIRREANGIEEGDIIVVTSKVLSKAHGLLIDIRAVQPRGEARRIAEKTGMDPKVVQVILDNSDNLLFAVPFRRFVERGFIDIQRIARREEMALRAIEKVPGLLIVRRDGEVYSNAGLDFSNRPEGIASIPPPDPDKHARELRRRLMEATGKRVAVIISDTEIAAFTGTLDLARGSSGIEVISKKFGDPDRFGKPKFGGVDNIAHELACTAALLMGQTSEGIPVVLVRGLKYASSEEGVSDHSISPAIVRRILKETVRETLKVVGVRRIIHSILSWAF